MRLLDFIGKGGLLLIVMSMSAGMFAQRDSGIKFCVTWQQATEFSKATKNRPIFVVVERSYNCPGCSQMEPTYELPEVAEHFNRSFANLRVDINSPDGVKFVAEQGLREFPAFLFFNGKGDMVSKSSGVLSPSELLSKGGNALRDLPAVDVVGNPYDGYVNLKNQRLSGTSSPDVIRSFCCEAKRYNRVDEYKDALADYIGSGAFKRVSSATDIEFLMKFIDDYDIGVYRLIVDNLQVFNNYYGSDFVQGEVKDALITNVKIAASQRNRSTFVQLLEEPSKAGLPNAELFELEMLATYYSAVNDWNSYAGEVGRRLSTGMHYAATYDAAARNFARHVKNDSKLEMALSWAKTAVENAPNDYTFRETYAGLLYLTGKKTKALKEADTAKQMASSQRANNYGSTLDLIRAMEANMPLPSTF